MTLAIALAGVGLVLLIISEAKTPVRLRHPRQSMDGCSRP
jgi:hypothetical protein